MKLATLETDLLDVAKKVKTAVEDAGDDAVKLAAWLQNNSAEVTALAGLAGPGASNAASVGLGLLNAAIVAVKGAGDAASANGVSVSLDSAAVADVKAVIAAIEKLKL
jgi:hypothetical protein